MKSSRRFVAAARTLAAATNGFTRITSFTSGNAAVMDLAYDRDTGYLWADCDDTCQGVLGILEIDTNAASPTFGKFLPPRQYARPPSMLNIYNEGFTLAPQSECVANRKPVFWSDDSETGGHSIRRATIACGVIP